MRRALPFMTLWLAGLACTACIPRGGSADIAPAPPVEQADQEIAPPPEVIKLPDAAPAWVARAVTPDPQAVDGGRYTVKSGDTLGSIGIRTGAGSEAIARANGIAPPYIMRVGQQLTIPGGLYHIVRQGESGIAIARGYGVAWRTLVALNGLEEPFVLRVGQRLKLPEPLPQGAVAAQNDAATPDISDILTGGEPAQRDGQIPARAVENNVRTLPSTMPIATPASFVGQFGWPGSGALLRRFGPVGGGIINDGIDIGMDEGSPILAAGDGVVAFADNTGESYGGLILVKHGSGWATAYGHASTLLVKRGQAVKRGEMIGRSGKSGYADRPALHFEIRRNSKPVDPLSQLPRR